MSTGGTRPSGYSMSLAYAWEIASLMEGRFVAERHIAHELGISHQSLNRMMSRFKKWMSDLDIKIVREFDFHVDDPGQQRWRLVTANWRDILQREAERIENQ